MHIKKPQSTNNTHKQKHSQKIHRFLQPCILNSAKKCTNSTEDIIGEKLKNENLENHFCLRGFKIMRRKEISKKVETSSNHNTRNHLRKECNRKSVSNLF